MACIGSLNPACYYLITKWNVRSRSFHATVLKHNQTMDAGIESSSLSVPQHHHTGNIGALPVSLYRRVIDIGRLVVPRAARCHRTRPVSRQRVWAGNFLERYEFVRVRIVPGEAVVPSQSALGAY